MNNAEMYANRAVSEALTAYNLNADENGWIVLGNKGRVRFSFLVGLEMDKPGTALSIMERFVAADANNPEGDR